MTIRLTRRLSPPVRGSRSPSRGIRPKTGQASSWRLLVDRACASVVLVLEVDDAAAVHEALAAENVPFLAEPYRPPWGGERFFCVDPDGYLVEIEQSA